MRSVRCDLLMTLYSLPPRLAGLSRCQEMSSPPAPPDSNVSARGQAQVIQEAESLPPDLLSGAGT